LGDTLLCNTGQQPSGNIPFQPHQSAGKATGFGVGKNHGFQTGDFRQFFGPPPESLISCLVEYDSLIAGERKGTRDRIIRTLQDRPWKKCGCAICKKWGIEVAVFRGNNRNRRRGFHNTHVFYRLLERLLAGENIPWLKPFGRGNGSQLHLF